MGSRKTKGPSPAKKNKKKKDPGIRVIDRRFWAEDHPDEDGGEEKSKKPSYVEELEGRVETTEQRLKETVGKHRKAVEEFESARTRLSREVHQEVERGKRAILTELLDVVDNLDRALEASADSTDAESLRKGVAMVLELFISKLEALGVRRATSLGEPFDPERHEAVSAVPVQDPDQDGRVVGVIKEAFLIGEELLRVALVAVGKLEDSPPEGG